LRVQFIHGLEGSPQGEKARFLAERFEATAPAMNTADFEASLEVQHRALEDFSPDVLVGSSFGGAVALELLRRSYFRGPTVLLAPAARAFGIPLVIPEGVPVVIVHGLRDELIDPNDSVVLGRTGSPGLVETVEVDDGHRLTSIVASGALGLFCERVASRATQWADD
jgi:predicted esterase